MNRELTAAFLLVAASAASAQPLGTSPAAGARTDPFQLALKAGGKGAEQVEAKLAQATSALKAELKTATTPKERIEALRKAVHETLKLGAETDPTREKRVEAVFPQSVLKRGKGACLGLSLIYLELARRTNLPLHGVSMPGHFFVRYRSNTQAWNLETTLGGVVRADAWYRRKAGLGTEQVGNYLTDLTSDEVAAEVLNNLGGDLVRAGKPKQALVHLARAVKLAPKDPDAHYNLACAHLAADHLLSAKSTAKTALHFWPAFKSARTLLGITHLRLTDYAAAKTTFDQVLALDPTDAAAWAHRGTARRFLKAPAQAVADFDRALKLRPGFPTALLGRAQVRLEQGQVPQAATDLIALESPDWNDLFLPLPAKAAPTLDALAARLRQAGKKEGATLALFAAGRRYLATKQPQKAQSSFNQALRIGHDTVGAYTGRGRACAARGDDLWAKRNFYLATQHDPSDPRGYEAFGTYYLERDEYSIALEYYRKYLKRAKTHPDRARIATLVKKLAAALGR